MGEIYFQHKLIITLVSPDPLHSRTTAIYNTNHYMKRQLELTNFVYLQSKGSACGGLGWGEVVGFGGWGVVVVVVGGGIYFQRKLIGTLVSPDPLHSRATVIHDTNHYMNRQLENKTGPWRLIWGLQSRLRKR